MARVDPWPPLALLGDEAEAIDRALAARPASDVERAVASIPGSSTERAAGLLVAKFSLAQRSGASPRDVEELGKRAEGALVALGRRREAAFVRAELATSIASDRTRLAEASAMLGTIDATDDDALGAAVARSRGALARTSGDLRRSLLELESARLLADRSGSVREIVRAENTAGSTYAALGVTALARASLERARELAEVAGERQSAAIASGQLAVLAFDVGDAARAARLLDRQRAIAETQGDVHGLARALALLVEARSALHAPAAARDAADQVRELHARLRTPWTRLQATLATAYELEAALEAGDLVRADELDRSLEPELSTNDPTLRVARARSAFAIVLRTLGDRSLPLESSLADAFARLRLSPRPTWVERLLLLGVRAATSRSDSALARRLAIRAATVLESRGAASSPSLAVLRELAPEEGVTRASVVGRDLVFAARLALAPLQPVGGRAFAIVRDVPGELDALLATADRAAASDELLVRIEGTRAVVASWDRAAGDRAAAAAGVSASDAEIRVVEDATLGVLLRTP